MGQSSPDYEGRIIPVNRTFPRRGIGPAAATVAVLGAVAACGGAGVLYVKAQSNRSDFAEFILGRDLELRADPTLLTAKHAGGVALKTIEFLAGVFPEYHLQSERWLNNLIFASTPEEYSNYLKDEHFCQNPEPDGFAVTSFVGETSYFNLSVIRQQAWERAVSVLASLIQAHLLLGSMVVVNQPPRALGYLGDRAELVIGTRGLSQIIETAKRSGQTDQTPCYRLTDRDLETIIVYDATRRIMRTQGLNGQIPDSKKSAAVETYGQFVDVAMNGQYLNLLDLMHASNPGGFYHTINSANNSPTWFPANGGRNYLRKHLKLKSDY